MRVYNLTSSVVNYRGVDIPANGGSSEVLMPFLPDRDRELERKKILSFGSLPKWWALKKKEEEAAAQRVAKKEFEPIKLTPEHEVKATIKVETPAPPAPPAEPQKQRGNEAGRKKRF